MLRCYGAAVLWFKVLRCCGAAVLWCCGAVVLRCCGAGVLWFKALQADETPWKVAFAFIRCHTTSRSETEGSA